MNSCVHCCYRRGCGFAVHRCSAINNFLFFTLSSIESFKYHYLHLEMLLLKRMI
ncbi:hypothetical protein E2C01_046293 [Portunus trituberculatus]|uniref:Uncharacterized protein n=1 Tax=Portunus trituberculatus TaxID=210409 RepID=A0A5B7G7D5_PORTR|nr:hypothetical protein [Portunus trituberculatus]